MPFDPAAPPGASDTLSLIVAGQSWTGWQRVWITRSMDQMPASFMIQVTEKYPNSVDVDFMPGQSCQVMIGSDLVITGYIDRYQAILLGENHTVTIYGRSLSEDLVDCSAFLGDPNNPTFQVKNATALSLVQQLAQPYGVTINGSGTAADQTQIPIYAINLGETIWEIIDRILRFCQLIADDLPDGSVQLAQAGSAAMASGFAQGQNVEQATVVYSMDQRFSIYEAHILSSTFFNDQQGLTATAGGTATDFRGAALPQALHPFGADFSGPVHRRRPRAMGVQPALGALAIGHRALRCLARRGGGAVGLEPSRARLHPRGQDRSTLVADRRRYLHARRDRPARAGYLDAAGGVFAGVDRRSGAVHAEQSGPEQPDRDPEPVSTTGAAAERAAMSERTSHQSQLDRVYRRMLMGTAPVLITTIDDTGPIQIAQIRINDTPEVLDSVPLMQFYGYSAVAPTSPTPSDATALFITGQRSNPVIVATNNQQARLKNQQPGEISLYSDEGDTIGLNRGNKINVNSKDTVTVNGQNNFTVNTATETINASSQINHNTPLVNVSGDLKAKGIIDAAKGFFVKACRSATAGAPPDRPDRKARPDPRDRLGRPAPRATPC